MTDSSPQTTNVAPRTEPAGSVRPTPIPAPGVPVGPNKTLYVADLAPTVTESTLLEFFQKELPDSIQSIRVCRDSSTGASLGYAYVNFHKADECDKALELFNFEPIANKPCRISKSIRDPSFRKSGVGNLFVKNLTKDIDHAGLHDVFCMFGEIISCKVATDKDGESKGYGFVHFADARSAEKAIEKLDGKCFNDKKVYVAHFIPRNMRAPPPSSGNWTNIYVKHLNKNVSSQEIFVSLITKATADIGKITSPKLMTKQVNEDGKVVEVSAGFGFVNFENHEVAKKALERFQDDEKMRELVPELIAEGEKFYANNAMSKEERRSRVQQDNNLYVKNIADTVTDEQFKELFELGPPEKRSESGEKYFGTITSAVIMKNDGPNAPHRGFGFVCYESKDVAAKALQEMNGYRLENKPLYVALAQPKELRQKHLSALHTRPAMPFGYPNVPYYGIPGAMNRYPGQGRPQFTHASRGRMPAFAGAPGRMGMPVGRPYPMPVPPHGHPHAPPAGVGQQADTAFYMDLVSNFDQSQISQKSADRLYNAFINDGVKPIIARMCTGVVLNECQTKPTAETVDYIGKLVENPELRRKIVQTHGTPPNQ